MCKVDLYIKLYIYSISLQNKSFNCNKVLFNKLFEKQIMIKCICGYFGIVKLSAKTICLILYVSLTPPALLQDPALCSMCTQFTLYVPSY